MPTNCAPSQAALQYDVGKVPLPPLGAAAIIATGNEPDAQGGGKSNSVATRVVSIVWMPVHIVPA